MTINYKEKDKHFKKEICVICNLPFYTRKKKGTHRSGPAFLKPIGTKTCSKKCSKIYLIKKEKERKR